jgi:hypothetical protein
MIDVRVMALLMLLCLTVLGQQHHGARFIFSSDALNHIIQKHLPEIQTIITTTKIPDHQVTEHVRITLILTVMRSIS